jgi:hypothetical protein
MCGSDMSSVAIVNAFRVKRVARRTAIFGVLLMCSCTSSFEARFYDRPPDVWPNSLAQLTPSQQWTVYLWGVHHIKPPPFELAVTLARREEYIMPFVVRTVLSGAGNRDEEGALAVLQMMREVVHYNPCDNVNYRGAAVQQALDKLPDATSYVCR